MSATPGHGRRRLQRYRPVPTLAQFRAYVAARKIRYFIASGNGGAPGTRGTGTSVAQITQGVKAHFTARTVDGVALYDLASR